MATLRPHIIRADTLDLQDSEAPSAKDHSRQPSHPEPLGEGPAAPHQDAELRHVEEERDAEERYLASQMANTFNNSGFGHHSSDDFGLGSASITHMTSSQQGGPMSEGSVLQNGGDELDGGDLDGDDRLEEEAMDDKISSSPSIDDGRYNSFSETQHKQSHADDRHSSSVDECWRWLEYRFAEGHLQHSRPCDSPAPAPRGHHSQNCSEESSQVSQLSQDHLNNAKLNNNHQRTLRRVTTRIESRNKFPVSHIPVRNTDPVFEDEGFGENLVPEHDWYVEDEPAAALQSADGSSCNSFEDVCPDDQWGDSAADAPLSPTGHSWASSEDSSLESEWNEDDDDLDIFYFSSDPRFIDSGWGGECLRDIEDIDFEFVYALHNFVATVEGQANATKGDTMVLLDDSNSYWWLVRIAKDNSIGYLPAEHIETPTERLARLNKHRNIDLSATMLGDNTERSKNPLKKAMRRRNARVVAFSQPTYVEPPEIYWSDDDLETTESQTDENQGRRKGSQLDRNDSNAVEIMQGSGQGQREGQNPDVLSDMEGRTGVPNEQIGKEAFDGQDDAAERIKPMRNTDSFYKDDSTGTKKISLTPDLLRDDSSRSHLRSPEPADRGASPEIFDMLGRTSPGLDKTQEDKKRKDKKTNMLSGLFKRKDKKIKVDEAAGNIVARQDDNGSTVFSPATSGRGSPSGRASPSTMLPQPSLRNTRSTANPLKSSLSTTSSSTNTVKGQERLQTTQGRKSPIIAPEPGRIDTTTEMRREITAPIITTERLVQFSNVHNDENSPVGAPLTRLHSPGPKYEPAMKLSESTYQDVASPAPRPELNINTTISSGPISVISPISNTTFSAADSFDQRPGQISPINTLQDPVPNYQSEEMKLAETKANVSENLKSPEVPASEEVKNSLEATPKSSTEDSVLSTSVVPESVTTPDSSSPAATPTTPTPTGEAVVDNWDPIRLAQYLDTDAIQDTKDMLSRVFNQIDVEPLPNDHPIMLEIGYHEVQAQLDTIGEELDTLLMDYLTRHGIDF